MEEKMRRVRLVYKNPTLQSGGNKNGVWIQNEYNVNGEIPILPSTIFAYNKMVCTAVKSPLAVLTGATKMLFKMKEQPPIRKTGNVATFL